MKRILTAAAGLALAGAGLYVFFRGDDTVFQTLLAEMSGTSAAAVAACLGLAVVSMWLRALRLSVMLPDATDGGALHKRGLFAVTTVSFMINNILPARLGEAARVLLLWKRNGFPVAMSIGVLLLERALDVIVYLAFLFVPVLFSPALAASLRGINPAVMAVIWFAFAAFAALIALFTLYAFMPQFFRKAAWRTGALLPAKAQAAAQKIGAELESSLGWIFSARKAAAVSALTVATCSCYAAMLTILVAEWNSFGILESMLAQAFAAFGSAIPLAPGSVGTLHAVLLEGLKIIGIEAGRARAVVVLYHGLQYVVITLLGLLLLAGMGLKFRDITKSPDGPGAP